MKHHYFLGIFILLAVTLFTACLSESSSDVNQDRIFTVYNLSYEAEHDITVATARFRFGNHTGTLLELDAPSEVSVNNSLMAYHSATALYSKNFVGFISEAEFVWTDTNGQEYRNTITLNTIDFPEITLISRESGFEIIWEGKPLGADEYVNLWVTDQAAESTRLFLQNAEASTSIIIPKSDLQQMIPGEAKIEISRGISMEPPESTEAGGRLSGQYKPEEITVTIE